jgi:ribonuclease HII
MIVHHETYPQYGFASNKGYGSRAHLDAIQEHGITPLHRASWIKN